jgi:hypothetical protein
MNKNINGLSLTIIGLIIASIGIIAPITWDWWNKRSEITIETKQSLTILQKEKSIEKLEITFDGKIISSLSKTIITLTNTGRISITKADVIEPVTIRFANSDILEVAITKQSPPNLNADLSNDSHNIIANFQLLNPGEELEISVLTAEGIPSFTANARIKNVSQIALLNLDKQQKFNWGVGIGPYIAGMVGLLFTLAGIGILFEYPRKIKVKTLLENNAGPIATASSIKEVNDYISTELKFVTKQNIQPLINLLSAVQDPLDDEIKKGIISIALECIEKEATMGPAFITFLIGGTGIWYATMMFLSL